MHWNEKKANPSQSIFMPNPQSELYHTKSIRLTQVQLRRKQHNLRHTSHTIAPYNRFMRLPGVISTSVTVAVLISLTLAGNCLGAEFDTLVARFYAEAMNTSEIVDLSKPKIPVIPVRFDAQYAGDKIQAAAHCVQADDMAEREIVVSERWWNKASELMREEVIFHELGHCALNRDHDETLITVDGEQEYASLMHKSVLYEESYQRLRSYYLREMFSNRPAFH